MKAKAKPDSNPAPEDDTPIFMGWVEKLNIRFQERFVSSLNPLGLRHPASVLSAFAGRLREAFNCSQSIDDFIDAFAADYMLIDKDNRTYRQPS